MLNRIVLIDLALKLHLDHLIKNVFKKIIILVFVFSEVIASFTT